MRSIKLAEDLQTNADVWRKASFAGSNGNTKFGLFPGKQTIARGAFLDRDAEGKIIDGKASHFTWPDGMRWFEEIGQSFCKPQGK